MTELAAGIEIPATLLPTRWSRPDGIEQISFELCIPKSLGLEHDIANRNSDVLKAINGYLVATFGPSSKETSRSSSRNDDSIRIIILDEPTDGESKADHVMALFEGSGVKIKNFAGTTAKRIRTPNLPQTLGELQKGLVDAINNRPKRYVPPSIYSFLASGPF